MQLKPPPEAIASWIELVAVQLVALGALAIGGWKLLMRPYRKAIRVLRVRHRRLKKAFEKDSFNIRTEVTSSMRQSVENEQRIDRLEQLIEKLATSMNENHEESMRCMRDVQKRVGHLEGAVEAITTMRGGNT